MQLQFADLTFDRNSRQLWVRGQEIQLSPKAFDLLALLIERRPNAVSKADINAHLWPGTFVSPSSLPSLVSEIREAIADHRRRPRLIRTLNRVGYAFDTEPPQSSAPHASPTRATGWLISATLEVALLAGENVIGREGEGIRIVKSTTISRRHARIVIDEQTAIVEDLESKNGTYVNSRRVSGATPVVDGDQIRLGSLLFTFRHSTGASSTETFSAASGDTSSD